MLNYTTASTESTPSLPRHEPLPAYSALEPVQLKCMDTSSKHMPFKTSASTGDNSTLPSTCEKSSPAAAPHSESPILQLPADTARVREFLQLLLTTKREMPAAAADEIVVHWPSISNGYQLRTYSKSQFKLIFGPEEGCVLWNDVDSCLENEQMRAQRWATNEKILIIGQWNNC
jgi:hypothetical protein